MKLLDLLAFSFGFLPFRLPLSAVLLLIAALCFAFRFRRTGKGAPLAVFMLLAAAAFALLLLFADSLAAVPALLLCGALLLPAKKGGKRK